MHYAMGLLNCFEKKQSKWSLTPSFGLLRLVRNQAANQSRSLIICIHDTLDNMDGIIICGISSTLIWGFG